MSFLLDTNILTRAAQPGHAMHQVALDSVAELRRQQESLHIAPQNIYEFWVVATRPVAQNGIGLTPSEADAELSRFVAWFSLLGDDPRILPLWRQLVVQHQVIGKSGHDARLVATMFAYGIDRLLTFNKADFARYQQITVFSPRDIIAAAHTP